MSDRRNAALKVAALDLGSNSFHLALAECRGEAFEVTASHKEKVQLGRSVFAAGSVDEPAFERGVAALRAIRGVIDAQRPDVTIAVATSALREAHNGSAFMRQAELILGVPLRLLAGDEEARFVALGTLRSLSARPGRLAIFDLGGGSTEVILAGEQGCSFVHSLRLGTLRLGAGLALGEERAPSRAELVRLKEGARGALEPTLARLGQLGFERLVLSCGAARRLTRLAGQLGLAEPNSTRLTRQTTRRLVRYLAALPHSARARLSSRDPAHVDTLLVSAIVFETLLSCLGVERALVSSAGLREGLIADHLERATRAALG